MISNDIFAFIFGALMIEEAKGSHGGSCWLKLSGRGACKQPLWDGSCPRKRTW